MTSSDARQIEAATAVLGHRSRVPTGIWGAKTFAKIRRRPESTASVIPTLTQDVKDLITMATPRRVEEGEILMRETNIWNKVWGLIMVNSEAFLFYYIE